MLRKRLVNKKELQRLYKSFAVIISVVIASLIKDVGELICFFQVLVGGAI
jgi:hypothetical protein